MPSKNAPTYVVPPETRRLLDGLAKRLKISRSAAVCLAISELAKPHKVQR